MGYTKRQFVTAALEEIGLASYVFDLQPEQLQSALRRLDAMISEWNGKTFNVIDTGGFVQDGVDVFEKEIRQQVMIAVEEANAIVFMCDVTTGITALDEAMADVLRSAKKPVFLVVNKVDNSERQIDATEFYSMGIEKTYFLSSMSGSGTGEVLDDIAALIEVSADQPQEGLPHFAIIGQPNVGKSSLLNALVGTERTIVSDIAGTTRDTIHTHYNLFQKEFILIDTAGIRRKTKVHEDLEFYSVIRAIKAMDEADVCLMMIDAEKGITQQDLNIFSLAVKKGKGIVFLVNKWDLVADGLWHQCALCTAIGHKLGSSLLTLHAHEVVVPGCLYR